MNATPSSGSVGTFLEAIKFSHSIFALPFALMSMVIAWGGWPPASVLFWVILACVSARTAAMSFNRLADRHFDARNPRTSGRALVTGSLSPAFMTRALAASTLLFFLSAAALNETCLCLAPPCLAVLLGYSLTKRFTHYTHFFLGAALGLAPVGGWIAVTGSLEAFPVALGIAVMLWVAGFDILYSCQDYEVDRRDPELHSLPKKLGLARAMEAAGRVHLASIAFLLVAWVLGPLGLWGLFGITLASLAILYQHTLVSPRDLSRINAAFFTTNGFVSIGVFLFALIDVLY